MTWEMHITPQALAGLAPEVTVRVAVTTIRDGTPGVSLKTSQKVLGEWTDSRACTVALLPSREVTVMDQDVTPRYRVLFPGTVLGGRQVSDTEVELSLSLEAGFPPASG
ncbi:MAG: hypothetical protein AAB270_06920 [Chloroflexota bacterium]